MKLETNSALPALKAAEEDPEFEVSLQIKMAIERIEKGEKAKGSVWKQMTDARTEKKLKESRNCFNHPIISGVSHYHCLLTILYSMLTMKRNLGGMYICQWHMKNI